MKKVTDTDNVVANKATKKPNLNPKSAPHKTGK